MCFCETAQIDRINRVKWNVHKMKPKYFLTNSLAQVYLVMGWALPPIIGLTDIRKKNSDSRAHSHSFCLGYPIRLLWSCKPPYVKRMSIINSPRPAVGWAGLSRRPDGRGFFQMLFVCDHINSNGFTIEIYVQPNKLVLVTPAQTLFVFHHTSQVSSVTNNKLHSVTLRATKG